MAILMRFDPNLRGDLAKLSDTELATRVDSTIKELDRTAPTFGLWMAFRGTHVVLMIASAMFVGGSALPLLMFVTKCM